MIFGWVASDLLIAADCTAYAYGSFHRDFMRGKVTLIACPTLDGVNYSEKLTEIFANNDIRSITLARVTVPCCGGLVHVVQTAIGRCGKEIPLYTAIISPDGHVLCYFSLDYHTSQGTCTALLLIKC